MRSHNYTCRPKPQMPSDPLGLLGPPVSGTLGMHRMCSVGFGCTCCWYHFRRACVSVRGLVVGRRSVRWKIVQAQSLREKLGRSSLRSIKMLKIQQTHQEKLPTRVLYPDTGVI
jgi:hypothetical protein